MNVFDLVMLVCLISDPQSCKEETIKVSGAGEVKSCMWNAQFDMAAWAADHPKYEIRKFTCEPVRVPT